MDWQGHTVFQGISGANEHIDLLMYTSLHNYPVVHISAILDPETAATRPPGLVQLLSRDQAEQVVDRISEAWTRLNVTADDDAQVTHTLFSLLLYAGKHPSPPPDCNGVISTEG
eukprot:1194046-Prorocentrum_minimum.AAC.1